MAVVGWLPRGGMIRRKVVVESGGEVCDSGLVLFLLRARLFRLSSRVGRTGKVAPLGSDTRIGTYTKGADENRMPERNLDPFDSFLVVVMQNSPATRRGGQHCQSALEHDANFCPWGLGGRGRASNI
jgi:hypothetical protein